MGEAALKVGHNQLFAGRASSQKVELSVEVGTTAWAKSNTTPRFMGGNVSELKHLCWRRLDIVNDLLQKAKIKTEGQHYKEAKEILKSMQQYIDLAQFDLTFLARGQK